MIVDIDNVRMDGRNERTNQMHIAHVHTTDNWIYICERARPNAPELTIHFNDFYTHGHKTESSAVVCFSQIFSLSHFCRLLIAESA